jgi:AraC family transcriptional regulator
MAMHANTAGNRKLLTPDERLRTFPLRPLASSAPLGWSGLRVEYYRGMADAEVISPGLTHHKVVLHLRPPRIISFCIGGVVRHGPPPGALLVIPAGTPDRPHFRGPMESVHVLLEPPLLARVAAEALDLNADRVALPPVLGVSHPRIEGTVRALHAELTDGGDGGRLLAESLGNVLAVRLLRQFVAPGQDASRPHRVLARRKLQAVFDYIEEHLDAELTLEHLAGVAHLSPYHFARLFKNSTGLPPHQFVVTRRVERAKELLRRRDRLALADIAAEVGFSSQSHFTHHFKRLVGVTPKRFP